MGFWGFNYSFIYKILFCGTPGVSISVNSPLSSNHFSFLTISTSFVPLKFEFLVLKISLLFGFWSERKWHKVLLPQFEPPIMQITGSHYLRIERIALGIIMQYHFLLHYYNYTTAFGDKQSNIYLTIKVSPTCVLLY